VKGEAGKNSGGDAKLREKKERERERTWPPGTSYGRGIIKSKNRKGGKAKRL